MNDKGVKLTSIGISFYETLVRVYIGKNKYQLYHFLIGSIRRVTEILVVISVDCFSKNVLFIRIYGIVVIVNSRIYVSNKTDYVAALEVRINHQ